MFLFSVILWTVTCACWAIKGLGWPFWQIDSSTTWHSLGPIARVDDSSFALVGIILLWVIGLAIIVSLKDRRP